MFVVYVVMTPEVVCKQRLVRDACILCKQLLRQLYELVLRNWKVLQSMQAHCGR